MKTSSITLKMVQTLMDTSKPRGISNISNKRFVQTLFKDEILQPCNEFISSFENILFLHVRRGDNVGREDYYRMMTFDYYKRHWNTLMMTYVLVCSDDPEWCKNKSSLMMKGS